MSSNLILTISRVWQEKEALTDYKWIESERRGYEVDSQEIILKWALEPDYDNSPAARFRTYFLNHEKEVLDCCKKHCGPLIYDCPGNMEDCPLTLKEIHDILKDWPDNTPPYTS